eukprot:TRINITY_DN27082_c0_g1_i3.p1 TRINITY_DN27082_c0_g1~~TRINITY_DN27082_c0_g1_i3.p1  ORF type:complete len:313 (-),score=46.23 TRINITY_DN27082_c0_g1_i3:74-1012(-)
MERRRPRNFAKEKGSVTHVVINSNWALPLEGTAWSGHRIAMFNTANEMSVSTLAGEMSEWAAIAKDGNMAIIWDRSNGAGRDRNLSWEVGVHDPKSEDMPAEFAKALRGSLRRTVATSGASELAAALKRRTASSATIEDDVPEEKPEGKPVEKPAETEAAQVSTAAPAVRPALNRRKTVSSCAAYKDLGPLKARRSINAQNGPSNGQGIEDINRQPGTPVKAQAEPDVSIDMATPEKVRSESSAASTPLCPKDSSRIQKQLTPLCTELVEEAVALAEAGPSAARQRKSTPVVLTTEPFSCPPSSSPEPDCDL